MSDSQGPAQSPEGVQPQLPDLAPVLASKNPLHWVVVFGPGAIVASLTIGTGELIFSARTGALFGYNTLWLFTITCLIKWALVFATGRHLVVSGAHPFERWASLPGPRAWFVFVMLLFGLLTFPVWVGFLSMTLGSLGTAYYSRVPEEAWGAVAVILVTFLAFAGGYTWLERIQMAIVFALLGTVAVSCFLLKPQPEWLEIVKSLFVPGPMEYPDWVASADPVLAKRPPMLETINTLGVIGGSGFDYLAYVSFLRNKSWGLSRGPSASAAQIEALDQARGPVLRGWIRAPLIDATVSFVIILVFSVVFVALGHIVLGAEQQVPGDENMLQLQQEFVSRVHPTLEYLYLAGAILALLGTVYGITEVAPAVVEECVAAITGRSAGRASKRVRFLAILWCSGAGLAVIGWSAWTRHETGEMRPPQLVGLITPVNLFTGVMACGFIAILSPWMDRKFLPAGLRMSPLLAGINLVGGVFFVGLSLVGYWNRYGPSGELWIPTLFFVTTVVFGLVVAVLFRARVSS